MSGVRCTNKPKPDVTPEALGYTRREWDRINAQDAKEKHHQMRLVIVLILLLALCSVLVVLFYQVVLQTHDYSLALPYGSSRVLMEGRSISSMELASSFAGDLAVADGDINTDRLSIGALSAGLFDLSGNEVIYSKDIFSTRSPASMTKIMTAIVALKYGNLDDIVVVTDTALDVEYGSSVCDIKVGDHLSLKQLLYGMIIASGNDAAMMVAEHVGGSVENFVQMMNDEARALGATRTHFANPHGLTDPEHYTCIYDLYLIFNEGQKNDIFMDMISRSNFYAEYTDGDGGGKAVTWETTNHYFTGEADLPESMIVYGGKTGTTEDAGACLILLAKDLYGNPYLGVIMHSEDKDAVYLDMNGLLALAA